MARGWKLAARVLAWVLAWVLMIAGAALMACSWYIATVSVQTCAPGAAACTYDDGAARSAVIGLRYAGGMLFLSGLAERVLSARGVRAV